MRTVRSFEVIALAIPLSLVACSKDGDREAKSANTARYEPAQSPGSSTAPHDDSTMTPASRLDEARTTPPDTMTPPPETQGAAAETQASGPITDAQIVALTDAANTSEVDAAKYAVAHAKNQRVRKFAQMMIDHHGKAKQDQARLVSKLGMTPEESTKLRDLRTSAADTDRTLKAAPDDMFDKVYIDIQVADHQMVLDSLDRDFIPNAQNAELKKSLQDFRPKVEQHLNQALELQKMLMSSPATKSGGSDSSGHVGTQESDKKRGNPTGSANGTGSGTGGPQRK